MSLPLPPGNPCYFCEIGSGSTAQWSVIERSELAFMMLNGRQFEVGQCIVAPTRHAPTLLDLSTDEISAVMWLAQRVAAAMVELYRPDGILLYQNNGVGSGQEVPHFHLHVVPRREGSDWGLGPPHLARFDSRNRPQKFDHTSTTSEKMATAEDLRQKLL